MPKLGEFIETKEKRGHQGMEPKGVNVQPLLRGVEFDVGVR